MEQVLAKQTPKVQFLKTLSKVESTRSKHPHLDACESALVLLLPEVFV